MFGFKRLSGPTVGLLLLSFVSFAWAGASSGVQQTAPPPHPASAKRSGAPVLIVPRSKWAAPPIRRPKPRKISPERKASLPPPDWIVVYRPATGEVRYEPPSGLAESLLKTGAKAVASSTGLLGRGPSPLSVIGTDERIRVTPTTDFPWRVIGKFFMTFPNNSQWVASGALIDPFHVLTAGHVVFNSDEGGWVRQLEFYPGLDGNYAPFSSAWDIEVRSPSGWVDQNNPDYDWGLVTLDRNIGAIIGWLGYAYEPLDYYPGKEFNLAGYPADLDQGLALYWSHNKATRATENVLYHVIDTSGGQSGSPVWRYLADVDQSHVMAVHTYGDTDENSATRINATRFNNIKTWCAEDLPPTDYADLIDDGFEYAGFSPSSVSSGGQFHVFCDVRNIGTTTALGFVVSFHASADSVITPLDPLIGTVFVPSVEPFTYVDVDWRGSFPASIGRGSWYVGYILDSSDNVAEYDENNTYVLPNRLIVGTPPNLQVVWGDFSPPAPQQLAPGDPLVLNALIRNTGGSAASPYWLEFWGSRTGGLMTDIFLADSAHLGVLDPGTSNPFSTVVPLAGVPDGPYTLVMIADRPNEIVESNESDNRVVVGGKRLLVIRPQTSADLAVTGFSLSPNPVYSGQAISMSGEVRNIGSEDSGPFWIEFWGSYNRLYPSMDFFLCDSIGVANLAPGQAIDLSKYARTLYAVPSGVFMVGVVVDRLDQINELDETNNYLFLDGYHLNQSFAPADESTDDPAKAQLPDVVVSWADFSPAAPYQAPPGVPMSLRLRIENRSAYEAGPFWLEFWGSRTGGLTLDEFIADSEPIGGLGPWGSLDLALSRSLYSIPDGPYTIVVVADRPGEVAESNEGNNRLAVAGKRLLTIRPQTQANLLIEGFSIGPNPLIKGQPLTLTGRVRNVGIQHSGPFWIEFFGTLTPDAPALDFFLCDSILVRDLPPSGQVDLSTYARTLYPWVPVGSIGVICIADRTDLVNETHEEDNYVVLKGYSISP